MESSGILGSPKTPVKKVTSKTHAARKDLVFLLCGKSLVGERCTFNVENHSLPEKLQSILSEKIDLTVQSCRPCRSCGRQKEKGSVLSSNRYGSSVQNTLCPVARQLV